SILVIVPISSMMPVNMCKCQTRDHGIVPDGGWSGLPNGKCRAAARSIWRSVNIMDDGVTFDGQQLDQTAPPHRRQHRVLWICLIVVAVAVLGYVSWRNSRAADLIAKSRRVPALSF